MSDRVCVIICNSGLGHLKRTLCLLDLCVRDPLLRRFSFDAFVHTDKLGHFPGLVKRMARRVRFHHVGSDGPEYEREFIRRYRSFLSGSGHVWSDNLVFPLKERSDTFLVGSFLWSQVYPGVAYYRKERALLKSIRPRMVGCRYFVTPSLGELTRLSAVGLYQYMPKRRPRALKPGILVSCGRTAGALAVFRRSLPSLRKRLQGMTRLVRVFIEPEFSEDLKRFKSVYPADFTPEMYSRVSAAVIRPGIGTVSDALSRGIRIFPVLDGGNSEIRHNARALQGMGVAGRPAGLAASLAGAASYLCDAGAFSRHLHSWEKLDFDGLKQTEAIIASFLREL